MSSAPVLPNPAGNPLPPGDSGSRATDKLVIYQHSHLFYWWPVWLLGFAFALVTLWDDNRLALVPAHTKAFSNIEVELPVEGGKIKETRDILAFEKGKKHHTHINDVGETVVTHPTIWMTHYRTLGSVYAIVLLLVIVVTNISIRGLWAVLTIVTVIMLTVILWAAGWWEAIFQKLNQLSIFVNLGGYLLISTVLFVLWLINFFLFDRQTYMIFTPGQVRVRQEVGGEEIVYDTTGMVVQKARNDMFRHWILGFGSGDLMIKPVSVATPIEFPNVLLVGAKVTKIENMIKEKVIVTSPGPKPAGT